MLTALQDEIIEMKLLIIENIRLSLTSIRGHMLRTVLTVLIIAFGIMALVGILTAIDSLTFFLGQNLQMMGANTFTIQNRSMRIHIGSSVHKAKYYQPISYREAMEFKDRFDFPAISSVYTFGSFNATAKNGSLKTNPNIQVIGSDENYLSVSGRELDRGRNINPTEVFYGSSVAIIGSELASKLFKPNEDPEGKEITIGPGKYRIIGILKSKGSGFGFSGDRSCIIPISNVRQFFARPNMSFSIGVMNVGETQMDAAIGEATGMMRIIRKNPLNEDNDFEITKSDQLIELLIENTKYITLSATIIGLITLIGAAIGLMNIMLVSVTERTREIGIRKAAGATKNMIRNQFLVESIVIGQLGGFLGITLGILIGNSISLMIGSSFIIPWVWIFTGVALCLGVALLSGIIPATKAANLDPIESLRYE